MEQPEQENLKEWLASYLPVKVQKDHEEGDREKG